MKPLEEKIKVMQACLDGKTIQDNTSGVWTDWKNPQTPDFNWSNFDYRIKPENKQVPFDFSDAESLVGRKVRRKDKTTLTLVFLVQDSSISNIFTDSQWFTFKRFAEEYEIWNNTLDRWESCTKTVKG